MLKLLVALAVAFTVVASEGTSTTVSSRSFVVDWDNDRFLKDGEPFRFVAGSFHYFRALKETWRHKLRTMRAAGLNAVTTYVEWSLHNPKENYYVWDGIADLNYFIQVAAEEGLLVILRPGPYICAERDMGGFPYWLLTKYPNIKLRTYDADYLREVEKWYNVLMPRIRTQLYGNGGPIIMVQVENEYGSFGVNDQNYKLWLKQLTEDFVGDTAVLFTNDGPSQTPRGYLEGVLATLDFGSGSNSQIDGWWGTLRKYMPKGPLVNIEYYPGWLTHWQEDMQRVDTAPVVNSLRYMLQQNASVNFYMFFGGTNFGFTAGANDGGPNRYNADVTSYDYDAPMTEAGDITPKYLAIRDVIGEFLPLPSLPIPEISPKVKFGPVSMRPISVLLSNFAKRRLSQGVIENRVPLTFEALNQYSGLVLYETTLPKINRDPVNLHAENVHDRAYVFVDRNFVGIMSRENGVDTLSVPAGLGSRLQIVVENQGRINFNIPNDFKGLLGKVSYNGKELTGWNMTKFPLDNPADILKMVETYMQQPFPSTSHGRSFVRTGPTFFYGTFNLTKQQLHDTYLNPTGWGKGIAYINGFNLGRYWPLVGPQISLYVPKELLKEGDNYLIMLEYQKVPDASSVVFDDHESLDG
ncbi:beta-galactosidase [Culicoides brevitarsis]|uniref:beta-galactosidase n=1 Tax=Culicoides brevitarsis TaxID=469753 RepID=UPI00307BFA19